MGYFDFLIDKNNKEPKSDIEYIYMLDVVWLPDKLGDRPIKPKTIVTNVIRLSNGSYEFKCKDTGEILRCNYAWALAENTPENINNIKIYEAELKKYKIATKKLELVKKNIKTLI